MIHGVIEIKVGLWKSQLGMGRELETAIWSFAARVLPGLAGFSLGISIGLMPVLAW